ncbi:uncharacterized protein LOC143177266 [Calliopsis andreniformis]|uniref:uncharacterized protein LOC143177266 n=1 Tax=Calliopsis andreniformis TaxID=337506 RepID=UPI003FCC50F8
MTLVNQAGVTGDDDAKRGTIHIPFRYVLVVCKRENHGHSAVDEESPGSIPKSLTVSPSESKDSSLDVPLESSRNIVFPLDSNAATEHLSSIRSFETKRSVVSAETDRFHCAPKTEQLLSFVSAAQDPRFLREGSILSRQKSFATKLDPEKSNDRGIEKFSELDSKVTIKLPSEDSLRTKECEDSSRITSSPEDLSDQEIVEVRKDSALFLEEAEGLPKLREILQSRGPRIIRPRSESSGYASNLGTFDEDRRSSSSTDVLQDLSSFLKERRRSSTGPKRLNSRFIAVKAKENLTEEIVNIESDKMPSTEVHRNVSSAGLDMSNIDEMKEILRDEASPGQENLDNLCHLMKHVSDEELSATDSNISMKSDPDVFDTSKTCISTRLKNVSKDVIDIQTLSESINRLSMFSTSKNALNQMIHQRTSPSSPNSSVRSITAKEAAEISDQSKSKIDVQQSVTVTGELIEEELIDNFSIQETSKYKTGLQKDNSQFKTLPRSVKMYQLLSTQSEDKTDRELHSTDRRISLQISKQDDATQSIISSTGSKNVSLLETRSISTLSSSEIGIHTLASADITDDPPLRKISSPGDVGTSQRFLGDASNVSVRPIYPYCPYSPYGSPQGSPRNRRRPLRESRRVSIDNRQGAFQLNQYKLLDTIGQGSFGIVKLVYNEEDETHYAMKILSKKKLMKKAGIFGRMAPGRKGTVNPLAKVYREIALLKKLDHPNVVKLVEVLDDPDEDNLYLVFELVQKGEILQIPTDKPLDEETARKNFRDVVMGVEYLHYQRIVHRDIKPSNLLVDSDGRIKIADLGVSAELRASGELLSGPAGAPAFAAPETTTPGAHYSGTLCDVWSMGVTLYSLATGRLPWDGAGSIIGVQAAVRSEPLKFPEKPILSENLRDLISRMLIKDPNERIRLAEIKEHPWITNCGTEPLPSEADNCRLPVTVTDEEVERVVTRIPKLDTLILIKTMLKQHSFQNPFLPKKSGKTVCADTVANSIELSPTREADDILSSRKTTKNMKTERFQRTGRSNSAPDSYDWQTNGRQMSVDNPLPPVTEVINQETETEKR